MEKSISELIEKINQMLKGLNNEKYLRYIYNLLKVFCEDGGSDT